MARQPMLNREGNLHIHKDPKYVDGTYHDGIHPISRHHRNVTAEGRALHLKHLAEYQAETSEKEKAISAKFASRCWKCGNRIYENDPIWWHPKTHRTRHRIGGCVDEEEGDDATEEEQPQAQDLAQFESAIARIAEKFEKDKAEIEARVAAEHAKLEERVEKAEKKWDAAKKIEVVTPKSQKPVKVGVQHKNFPKLLQKASYVNPRTKRRINVAMVGDAGSGKTTAPRMLAKALKLPFYACPIGPQTSKSDLLGFINGAGKYVYSLLRKAYEYGGVALIDELDAGNPGSLTIAHGMLDALEAGFADKMVEKHPDCIFIAAMNTYGRGADMLFTGRAQLDAATLNRWYWLDWDTDWDLTRALVQDDEWVNYLESLYNSIARQKVRAVVRMRTAMMGKDAMLSGDTREEAELAVIWRGMKPDDKQKILAGIREEESI